MRFRPGLTLLFSIPLLSAVVSCTGSTSASDPLAMQVAWGLTGTSVLPADVDSIEVETCALEDGVEVCGSFSCTINALTLAEGVEAENCRPADGTEMFGDSPVLIRRDLPTDQPVRFELRGYDAAEALLYVGHAGPFVLGEGERRNVTVRMYRQGAPALVPGADVGRILHTATELPDGRVLIAGGFDTVRTLAMCPEELTLVSETQCFALTATSSALAFDVTSGTLEPIRSAMLTARGGHTATELPDGRVLLAGGSGSAVLAMIPQGVGAVSGYEMRVFPADSAGEAGSHATYEIFDAFLDIQADDVGRDGDPGAGRFFGIAGTGSLGSLNQGRFMHAAAVVPNRPSQVLLVGGLGGVSSEGTYEVFDAEKAGGFGVYQSASNTLSFPRGMPGAVGMGDEVWIFGGASAASNDDLAEIWTLSDSAPNGTLRLATETEFPNSVIGLATDEERPEYSLLRPTAVAVDEGRRALVVGWYGALCEVGMTAPVFSDVTPSEYCNSPVMSMSRTFTVSASSGLTIPTIARPHSFGGLATLTAFSPEPPETEPVQYYAVTGGIANAVFGGTSAVDVFSGRADSSGAASLLSGVDSVTLQSRRFFHTSTGVSGLGMLTVGGMTFSPSVDQIFFETDVEMVYLPR